MKSKTVAAFYSFQNSMSSSHRTQTEVPHTGISCTILQLLWWEATMNQMPCIIYSVQRDWKFSAQHIKIAATGYTKFKKTENQEHDVVTPQASVHCSLCALSTGLFFGGIGASKWYIPPPPPFFTQWNKAPLRTTCRGLFISEITALRQNLLYMLYAYEQHYYVYTLIITGDGWIAFNQTRKQAFSKPVDSIYLPGMVQ